MGDSDLEKQVNVENGADGAYWPDTEQTLGRACLNIQSYLNQTGQVYGSPRLFTTGWEKHRRDLEAEFSRLTGKRFDQSDFKWSDNEIKDLYEDVRKGYYKIHRDGQATITERPLFGIDEGAAALYAHTAFVADIWRWTIKIGYTTKDPREYIRCRDRAHAPAILATTIGDKVDEKMLKRRFRHCVASGDEWMWPETDIAEYIAREFRDVVPNYWSLVEQIRDQNKNLSIQT